MFVTEDRFAGADTNTRRALAQAGLDAPSVERLREAIGLTKLKAEFPAWKESAWAHAGIPAKKVAIVIIASNLTNKSENYRKSWARYGWRCFTVPRAAVERSSPEGLARELLEAIGGGK